MTLGLMRGTIHRCTKFSHEMFVTSGLIKVRAGKARGGWGPGRQGPPGPHRSPRSARVLCVNATWRRAKSSTGPWFACTSDT